MVGDPTRLALFKHVVDAVAITIRAVDHPCTVANRARFGDGGAPHDFRISSFISSNYRGDFLPNHSARASWIPAFELELPVTCHARLVFVGGPSPLLLQAMQLLNPM